MKGMIHVYTGKGKGKTSAAIGLAMRAVGADKRVAIIAFDKGGEGHYSERDLISRRIPEISFFATGCNRFNLETQQFRFGVTQEDMAEGQRGLEIAYDLMSKNQQDVLILDEINSSVDLKIIKEEVVLDLLDKKPEGLEIILTGRNAAQSFINRADLVTEMTLVKHYYYSGQKARQGIDY